MSEEIKKVAVVTDRDGEEAIYVNGFLKFDDATVYACDIATHAGGEPILLTHHSCEFDQDYWSWPEEIKDVPNLDASL